MPNKIDRFEGEYRFLSNFWNHPVSYDGAVYANNEAAFQAAKCLDKSERRTFERLSPRDAKHLGRRVRLRPDWESVKISVMTEIVREKFKPGTELAARLLATGDAELIEGNHWNDRFWGVCNGTGRNELGKILMEIRAELREGAEHGARQ